MNTNTGEIEMLDLKQLTELQRNPRPEMVELKRKPKTTCRKCYGRGHIGLNRTTNSYVICKCCK